MVEVKGSHHEPIVGEASFQARWKTWVRSKESEAIEVKA
jgi:hypothetical protein